MDTTAFRSALLEEKDRLEQSLSHMGRRNPSNPADWEPIPQETGQEADISDAADHSEANEANAVALNDLEIRYNEVLAALGRMDAGTYGICEVSGNPIEPERLAADPAVRTCKMHMNG